MSQLLSRFLAETSLSLSIRVGVGSIITPIKESLDAYGEPQFPGDHVDLLACLDYKQ
jgi:hypothetical protein